MRVLEEGLVVDSSDQLLIEHFLADVNGLLVVFFEMSFHPVYDIDSIGAFTDRAGVPFLLDVDDVDVRSDEMGVDVELAQVVGWSLLHCVVFVTIIIHVLLSLV